MRRSPPGDIVREAVFPTAPSLVDRPGRPLNNARPRLPQPAPGFPPCPRCRRPARRYNFARMIVRQHRGAGFIGSNLVGRAQHACCTTIVVVVRTWTVRGTSPEGIGST